MLSLYNVYRQYIGFSNIEYTYIYSKQRHADAGYLELPGHPTTVPTYGHFLGPAHSQSLRSMALRPQWRRWMVLPWCWGNHRTQGFSIAIIAIINKWILIPSPYY